MPTFFIVCERRRDRGNIVSIRRKKTLTLTLKCTCTMLSYTKREARVNRGSRCTGVVKGVATCFLSID